MRSLLRLVQLLAIVIWVGGIVFFAFVLAPVSFHTLPSVHLAGAVVGAALKIFDVIGLGCGMAFLFATALLYAQSPMRLKGRYELEFLLAGAMVIATAYLHWAILPAMDRDRVQAGGDVASAASNNPARMHFDRLHQRSEHTEGAILLMGLGVVFLLARAEAQPDVL